MGSHVTENVLTPAPWRLVHRTAAGNCLNTDVHLTLEWKKTVCLLHSVVSSARQVSPRLTALLRCTHATPSTLPAHSELRAREVAHAVIAVGFACFGMNLVGVNASGKPCTPVFTYAGSSGASCGPSPSPPPPAGGGSSEDSPAGDCSGEEDVVKRLRKSLERMGRGGKGGLEEARRRTGAPTHVSYAPAQLLRWLQETTTAGTVATPTRERVKKGDSNQRRWRSPQRSQVKLWQTLPSLIAARWCCLRSAPVSYSEASWTGMLDLRKLEVSAGVGWGHENGCGRMRMAAQTVTHTYCSQHSLALSPAPAPPVLAPFSVGHSHSLRPQRGRIRLFGVAAVGGHRRPASRRKWSHPEAVAGA